MKISDLLKTIEGTVLCGENRLDMEVKSACGSDMMSDVLAYVKDQGVLLTGLVNPQVVRTSEMMDMKCIVFVRGKVPDKSVIELADSKEMVLICTKKGMFESCGRLYSCGLGH